MRKNKDGTRNKQDWDIQDYGHPPVDPVMLITGNLRTARNILASNMQRYGDKLPVKLRSEIAVILKNMEGVG